MPPSITLQGIAAKLRLLAAEIDTGHTPDGRDLRCVSPPHCVFAFPAPDMPSASYQECIENAKSFDFARGGHYWTEVDCVEVPKDQLPRYTLRGAWRR